MYTYGSFFLKSDHYRIEAGDAKRAPIFLILVKKTMGTKVCYIKCVKCGELSPVPTYDYKKGFLSEKAKKKCTRCLQEIKKYRIEPLAKFWGVKLKVPV